MKNIFFPFRMEGVNENPPGNGTPPSTPPVTPPAKSEHEKELERVMQENASLRTKSKDAETKAQQALDEIANLKKAGNKTSGDWKAVAETAEAEADKWKKKCETLNTAFVNTIVGGKVKEEALKNGYKPDLTDLLDGMQFDEIECDVDDNLRFNLKGVDTAIANLKKVKPSLFGEKQPPQFNAGGGGGSGGSAPKGDVESTKAAYLIAFKNRLREPDKFNVALAAYQKAIRESKAKK